MSRRKPKDRKRKQKRKERRASRRPRPAGDSSQGTFDLVIRRPDLARPPVYVNVPGTRIPDPYATLGLSPDPPPTPEAVRSAFRAALSESPPESDPQRARELVEARDLLLDPRSVLARTLGDLRVPDPEHFLPFYVSERGSPASTPPPEAKPWSSRTRLVALMTLYALLEAELDEESPPKEQTGWMFD